MKLLETYPSTIEEVEEFAILRDLCDHPNLPKFFGVFVKQLDDSMSQLWMAMEVFVCCKTDGVFCHHIGIHKVVVYCDELYSIFICLQLCSGGSVSNFVKLSLDRGYRIDELIIAYITKDTLKVSVSLQSVCLIVIL